MAGIYFAVKVFLDVLWAVYQLLYNIELGRNVQNIFSNLYNILRAFDSDTCYIIYRDAGYIIIRLHIGKSTKKSLTKIPS